MAGTPRTEQNGRIFGQYVMKTQKFKEQVGALMCEIDSLAKTASSTHFRALF